MLYAFTCWHMFLYWYNPSFAIWLFLSSTHSCKYISMMGSWIFCHVLCFLLLMTSYSASKALSFLPTSINSEEKIENWLKEGHDCRLFRAYPREIKNLPLARLSAFSGRWKNIGMMASRATATRHYSILLKTVKRLTICESVPPLGTCEWAKMADFMSLLINYWYSSAQGTMGGLRDQRQ